MPKRREPKRIDKEACVYLLIGWYENNGKFNYCTAWYWFEEQIYTITVREQSVTHFAEINEP